MNATAQRPLEIEMIREMARESGDRRSKAGATVPEKVDACEDLFIIQTATDWLLDQNVEPDPAQLFGNFWYEGELCILFADTNMGKSVLAVQIADAISRGRPVGPFAMQAEPATVLYVDFELSAKQFELRYFTEEQNNYPFSKQLYRAEFKMRTVVPYQFKDFDDYLNSALHQAIRRTRAQVLIIDNITSLRNGTERADSALHIMRHLKAMKDRYKLSVLVLAHTPKRHPGQPLTRNDLQGSKMLINFADSAFAIGESHSSRHTAQQLPDGTPMGSLRYLKQVKQRSGGEVYGAANVCLCRLARQQNFLSFHFEGYAHEADHLRAATQQQRDRLAQQVAHLLTHGKTQRQIAAELQLGLATVNRLAQLAKSEY